MENNIRMVKICNQDGLRKCMMNNLLMEYQKVYCKKYTNSFTGNDGGFVYLYDCSKCPFFKNSDSTCVLKKILGIDKERMEFSDVLSDMGSASSKSFKDVKYIRDKEKAFEILEKLYYLNCSSSCEDCELYNCKFDESLECFDRLTRAESCKFYQSFLKSGKII